MNNQTAVETAKENIDSIKQSIVEGNTDLTPQHLRAATDELEFALLREEAALLREQRQLAADRREKLLSLQKSLAQLSDSSLLEKTLSKVAGAIEKYLSEVAGHNQKIAEIREELRNGGFAKGPMPGQLEGIPTSEGRVVQIGAASASSFEPREKLDRIFNELIRQFSARR